MNMAETIYTLKAWPLNSPSLVEKSSLSLASVHSCRLLVCVWYGSFYLVIYSVISRRLEEGFPWSHSPS